VTYLDQIARTRPGGVLMRVFVLFNAKAGSARSADAVRQLLAARVDVTVVTPRSPEETRREAARAKADGYDCIVAAGGDGTIHNVVNGLAPDFGRARLAVLPLGTGNDLRRTLAVPEDPTEALGLLDTGSVRRIDLFRVETPLRTFYGVNTASGGFGGQVLGAVTEEMKAAWGPLAYLRGAAAVLPDLRDYHTLIRFDDGPEERFEALNVIVANGRFAAHGWRVASRADIEDGLLDVIVVRYGPLFDLTAVAAQLLAGDYLDSGQVTLRRARRIRIESRPPMWFSIDGELTGEEPITSTVLPKALDVIVGPEYHPTPEPAS
jgi:diacylglycerol kinase (ATP)